MRLIGGIILLLLLILWTRLGVNLTFGGEQTVAKLTIGPFKIQLAPPKAGKKTPKSKKEPETKDDSATGKSHLSKSSLTTIQSAVTALAPAGKKALRRTRRSVKIHPLNLSVLIGGSENAAEAAQQYGYAQALVWSVMPPLEELLVIPDPRIHIGLDFSTAQIRAEGEAGCSIRIGTLISLGFCLGIPALRWFLSNRKQHKEQPPAPKTEHSTAA